MNLYATVEASDDIEECFDRNGYFFFLLLLETFAYGQPAAIISVTKCGRRIIKLCSSSKLQPNIKRQSRRKNRFFIIYYVSY